MIAPFLWGVFLGIFLGANIMNAINSNGGM